jgi:hypothetical protein
LGEKSEYIKHELIVELELKREREREERRGEK